MLVVLPLLTHIENHQELSKYVKCGKTVNYLELFQPKCETYRRGATVTRSEKFKYLSEVLKIEFAYALWLI